MNCRVNTYCQLLFLRDVIKDLALTQTKLLNKPFLERIFTRRWYDITVCAFFSHRYWLEIIIKTTLLWLFVEIERHTDWALVTFLSTLLNIRDNFLGWWLNDTVYFNETFVIPIFVALNIAYYVCSAISSNFHLTCHLFTSVINWVMLISIAIDI